jgi:hypothetical protein
MTPEASVKAWAKRQYAIIFPGHWYVSPRGGAFGKAGCPDHLICWQGIFIAIEVKSLEGSVSGLQIIALKEIQAAGGVAAVLRGKDLNRLLAIREAVMRKVGTWDSA